VEGRKGPFYVGVDLSGLWSGQNETKNWGEHSPGNTVLVNPSQKMALGDSPAGKSRVVLFPG